MNKFLCFSTMVTSALVLSTSNGEGFVLSNPYTLPSEITFFCQDNSYVFDTVSTRTIKAIEEEIDLLEEDKIASDTFDNFINTANMMKNLVMHTNIKKLPDVVLFHKGYVGLSWDTTEDKAVFVYAMPDGTLFFHMVGSNNYSERFTVEATAANFADLLQRINKLV